MGVSARMKVSGILTAATSSACTNPVPPFDIWWNGNRFAHLGPVGGAAINWFIGPITGQEFPNSFAFFDGGQPDSGVAIWTPTELDNNSEIIFRREPFTVACGSSPAYLLSGQQQVQVDFMTVHVTASKTSIQANEPVTFTATPINFTPSDPGYIYWEYHRDDAPGVPIAVEGCFGQPNCTFAPPARGKMLALMVVSGGAVPGYSAAIGIIKCPTGDPLLDGGLTDELARLMQKSLATPNKKEFPGVVWQDRATGVLRFQELTPVDEDPLGCWIVVVFPPSTSTEKLVAIYHTHPRGKGGVFSCTNPETGAVLPNITVDFESWGGGSEDDWETALWLTRREGSLVPSYVMDLDRMHKLNPVDSASTSWRNNAQHWQRCTIQ